MKKNLFVLLCANSVLFVFSSHAINLRDAIKQKLVKTDVRWRAEENQTSTSSRHGKNICLSLQNLTASNLAVEVPAGFMFTPADSTRQNMMITEDLQYQMAPAKKQTLFAHGYCCEAHDGAPSENAVYLVKKPADKKLQLLANFVRDNNMEGYGVQRAIWSVSDKYDIWDIDMENPEQTNKLIQATGILRGMSDSEIAAAQKMAAKRGAKTYEKMITLEIPIEQDTQMWILIQDINNRTVKVIMTKQDVKKGVFKTDIGLSSIDFGGGTFFIRAYSTHAGVVEKKVKLDV